MAQADEAIGDLVRLQANFLGPQFFATPPVPYADIDQHAFASKGVEDFIIALMIFHKMRDRLFVRSCWEKWHGWAGEASPFRSISDPTCRLWRNRRWCDSLRPMENRSDGQPRARELRRLLGIEL